MYKYHEPLFADKLFFKGDNEYRLLLGLGHGIEQQQVTVDNIDDILENTFAFLMSLCSRIQPGHGLDPLNQPSIPSDKFVLYRMLLLKQL